MSPTRDSTEVLDVLGQRGGAMPSIVTLYDRSRERNNGTFAGGSGITQLRSGQWVATFDGVNGQIGHGNAASVQIIGNLTIMGWVYFNAVAGVQTIVGKNYTNEGTLRKGNAGEFLWNQGNGVTEAVLGIGGTFTIPNRWYHVAIVRNIATTRCFAYVNGQVMNPGGTVYVRVPTVSGNTLRLGNDVGLAQFLNGMLSQVRIAWAVLPAGYILNRFESTRRLYGV
jgi:hypothetical protein